MAFEDLFWLLNDATFITVITYAPIGIIFRPVGRSNFEYPLVDPVLSHVQGILVNRLLVLKQVVMRCINLINHIYRAELKGYSQVM